jgi:hypothetical protein
VTGRVTQPCGLSLNAQNVVVMRVHVRCRGKNTSRQDVIAIAQFINRKLVYSAIKQDQQYRMSEIPNKTPLPTDFSAGAAVAPIPNA